MKIIVQNGSVYSSLRGMALDYCGQEAPGFWVVFQEFNADPRVEANLAHGGDAGLGNPNHFLPIIRNLQGEELIAFGLGDFSTRRQADEAASDAQDGELAWKWLHAHRE